MTTEDDVKISIKAAASILLDVVLRELQEDPHSWSDRPCSTCKTISSIVGKPFGCYLYALRNQRSK